MNSSKQQNKKQNQDYLSPKLLIIFPSERKLFVCSNFSGIIALVLFFFKFYIRLL